jgi:glycosyl hydrolase family 123
LNCARSTRPPIRSLSRTLLALLLAVPLSTRAATVWVASSTEKLRGDAPAGAAGLQPVRLTAARNEFEAFQIAVTGAASGVRATATALRGPGGASIPAPRLFREAIYQVSTVSSPDSPGVGPYPDAMVPDVDDVVGEKRNAFPFEVLAGQTRVIWVEALVPAAAPAGDYTGTVTVDGAGLHEVVSLTLHVWNFALPTTSSLRSHYGLSWPEIPAGHGFASWSAPGSADDVLFTGLRARYAQIGLDHRISIGGFNDNHFDDVGHFEKYFGPFMDGTAPTQLPGARLTSTQFIPGANDSLQQQQVKATAWVSRFKSHTSSDGKSWFDRLFDYTCDEPGNICSWSTIAGRAAMVKAADPAFRTLVTTTIDGASQQGVAGQIDLMVVVINWLDGKPGGEYAGNQRSHYDAFLAPGGVRDPLKEIWTYQGCSSHGTCGNYQGIDPIATGWPSLVIDAEAMRARSLEWQSFINDVSGELYYATTLAYTETGDPWSNQYVYGGHGDGTLFYPGTPARIGGQTHIPVASLRLKMIREGSEDFEYLKLLSGAGEAQFARSIATSLFPNAWSVPTASALLAAREQIAARIEAKLAPAVSPVAAGDGGVPGVPPDDAGSQPVPGTGTGAGTVSAGVPGEPAPTAIDGSGCSAGATADVLAGIGLAAAMLLRRRRSR